jgi:hypothetical protein
VIILVKKASIKMVESDDKAIQKMAWNLFQYLSVRGIPKGYTIPGFNETARKAHAEQFQEGIKEFTSAVSNYIAGYARSMEYDEKKYKADYASATYRTLSQSLAKI